MEPVILFRNGFSEQKELEICKKYFKTVKYRSEIPENSLVIPRYSALPYYKELEQDVKNLGSKLINSYREHRFVADISNWYLELEEYTPKTWFSFDKVPRNMPLVLKGETNSMKFSWDTHMYAKDKNHALSTYLRLQKDMLIGSQSIVVREYIPLRRVSESITSSHPPFSKEYRFFILNGKIIAGGFYWSSLEESITDKYSIDEVPQSFIKKVINSTKDRIPFYVIDVAETKRGDWIVVELNDGQMSGLSCIDYDLFYSNLKKGFENE